MAIPAHFWLFVLATSFLVLFFIVAVAIGTSGERPMSLRERTYRAAEDALREAFKPGGRAYEIVQKQTAAELERIARSNKKHVGELTDQQFVWQVAFELIRAGNLGAWEARDMAIETVRLFLTDNDIKFGDARYGWDQEAAKIVAREYQIEHWEVA